MLWIMTAAWIAILSSPVVLLVAFLPAGTRCPRCASGDTLPIRWTLLRPVRRWLARRWCTACGWEGIVRRRPAPRPTRRLESVPDAGEDEVPWRSV